MSDRKPARTKPPVTPRSLAESRASTATRSAAGVRPRPRARSAPVTYPGNTTSTESIAASIVGLMVLAADSGTPGKIVATDKSSLEVKAALADLIAVRFDADD
jgi:phosphotransferase system HPr-like phosphotransfer protein